MKKVMSAAFAVACGLLLSSSLASAAPVGTFTCTSGQASISANVSYYSLGITNPINIGSQSGGAGAGKVTLQPLTLRTSLQNFQQFFALASGGLVQPLCTLSSTFGDGTHVVYSFKDIAVANVQASATAATHDSERRSDQHAVRFTEVQLVYVAINVQVSGGSDDGGNPGDTTSSGWNRVTNNPVPPLN